MDDDEVVAQSLERRVKWSMDASADDCSRVFQKVIKLEKCMKDALKRKEDTDKIQQLYQMLRTVRMYQPTETSNEEEEKTAEQVDADLTPLEIVVETRMVLDEDFESHRKAAMKLIEIEEAEIDGVKVARIKNSVAACRKDDCFVQEASLSVYAFVILNELSKREFIDFEYDNDPKTRTLIQSLESFGRTDVKNQGPSMKWDLKRITFTGLSLGSTNGDYKTEFDKFMHADLTVRNNSEQTPTEKIRQEYVNIWNTVCSPEFIYAITKPEDRIGREFPENGNTSTWVKSLEGVENLNQVCNQVVGYADDWCVNILITPTKIFFPRLSPDLSPQYQRYVALCRYDDAAQGFGLLVFDIGPRQLTFVRNIESDIKGKHIGALHDWFARGFAKYAGEDRRELPEIKIIDFSPKTDQWKVLCEKLGSSTQSVSWCVLNSLSDEDKCAGLTGEGQSWTSNFNVATFGKYTAGLGVLGGIGALGYYGLGAITLAGAGTVGSLGIGGLAVLETASALTGKRLSTRIWEKFA
jgi:hypothetical protein